MSKLLIGVTLLVLAFVGPSLSLENETASALKEDVSHGDPEKRHHWNIGSPDAQSGNFNSGDFSRSNETSNKSVGITMDLPQIILKRQEERKQQRQQRQQQRRQRRQQRQQQRRQRQQQRRQRRQQRRQQRQQQRQQQLQRLRNFLREFSTDNPTTLLRS
ncbi:KIN17-like protein [Periplaneta americana]|uniref:KIN17-like protein n=1 Tax=Periplaneta americana TaxID=6978 RepID=UPI0037E70600